MRSIFALFLSWMKKLFAKLTGKDITDAPTPGNPGNDQPDKPEPDPGNYVCYYGCPNSKRAEKLQLSRKLYK